MVFETTAYAIPPLRPNTLVIIRQETPSVNICADTASASRQF